MKDEGLIDRLLMPIGRTMRDVDIFGIDNKGQIVFAQVTFGKGSDINNKRKRLAEFKGHLYFFSHDDKDFPNIKCINIGQVFNHFKNTNLLKNMLLR